MRRLGEWINTHLHWVYLILILLALMGLFLMGIWVYNVSLDKNNLVIENKHRIDDIQKERESNIRFACESTNERHKNALVTLTQIYDNARKEAIENQRYNEIPRINSSQAATISVIDALVPVQDCDAQVKKLLPSAAG